MIDPYGATGFFPQAVHYLFEYTFVLMISMFTLLLLFWYQGQLCSIYLPGFPR